MTLYIYGLRVNASTLARARRKVVRRLLGKGLRPVGLPEPHRCRVQYGGAVLWECYCEVVMRMGNRENIQILCGDCLEILRTLESGSVHCCVTSPPY